MDTATLLQRLRDHKAELNAMGITHLSVFGSRADAERLFGATHANMVLIDVESDADVESVLASIREASPGLAAGSSLGVRDRVQTHAARSMGVVTGLAVAVLALSCLGSGNLVIASLSVRRFEFGVLRAIGGSRGMIVRVLLAETVLVALVGCVLGTSLGLVLAAYGRVFHERLFGLSYAITPAWDVVGWGAAAVILAALLAAAPALHRLARTAPRELLASRTMG